MRSLISGAVCFAAALLLNAGSNAATIEPVQGELSINQGQGFQKVNTRIDANVGDSVMVSPGGVANLVYPDGCTVNVQPGAVVSIAPLSPCASGSFAQQTQTDNWNTGAIIGGALFAAGTGVAIYGIVQSHPTSP